MDCRWIAAGLLAIMMAGCAAPPSPACKYGEAPPPMHDAANLAADAGPDQQVSRGSKVSLDGSHSEAMQGQLSGFFWRQTGGACVILEGAREAKPAFTAPSTPDYLTFELVVAQGGSVSSPDSIDIEVR